MERERFPTFRRIGAGIVRISRRLIRAAPKVGFALLVLFVLAAIPWTYFNIKYGGELEAELARIKAAGEPVTLAEVVPKPVPDEQNAAVLYQKVFNVSFEGGPRPAQEEPARDTPRRGFNDMPEWYEKALVDYFKGKQGSVEAQVRQVFEDPVVRKRLEILRRASERPYCVFPINWQDGWDALLPHLATFRQATRYVTGKMLITAADGDVDGALAWGRVGLRMSEHAAQEPTLVGQLVGTAMRTIVLVGAERMLSDATPSMAAAAETERHVAGLDASAGYVRAMQAERGLGRWAFTEGVRRGARGIWAVIGDGPSPGDGARVPLWVRLYVGPLGAPVRSFDELQYLAYMREVLEISRKPFREVGDTLDLAARQFVLPIYRPDPLTRVLCPAFGRMLLKRDLAIAQLDISRLALALKAYKHRNGVYPQKLVAVQDLVSGEVPRDVFSGELLHYESRGEGFILYSVGQNLKDDGGLKPNDEKNIGWADGDVVWECSR